jgi:hypothetical protein
MTIARSHAKYAALGFALGVVAVAIYMLVTKDASAPQAILGKASVSPFILGKA